MCKVVFFFNVLITVATNHFKFHSSFLAKRITFFEITEEIVSLQSFWSSTAMFMRKRRSKTSLNSDWTGELRPKCLGERVLKEPFLTFVNISQTIDFSYTLKNSIEGVEEHVVLTASALASPSFKTEVFRLRVHSLQQV